ncbi:MAG: O-methyltransferase [Erysipelotrichaceae bacterium]|nr:O-methyltransferase [Erysipelotrichaceae bacterium]
MNLYLEKFNNENEVYHEFFDELRNYAKLYNVPIIKRDSLVLIQSLLNIINAKTMLEIGTAIGYSALSFVCSKDDLIVDTIERNEEMYKEACKNIKQLNKQNNINVIFQDALEVDNTELRKYDVIFIDAAKAQYQKFFDKYAPLLNENGIILTDNIIFHGCVEEQENLSKNVRSMVKKIDNYNHYLSTLEEYITYYIDSGDGLAITMRKK